jgi:hypothetical protein
LVTKLLNCTITTQLLPNIPGPGCGFGGKGDGGAGRGIGNGFGLGPGNGSVGLGTGSVGPGLGFGTSAATANGVTINVILTAIAIPAITPRSSIISLSFVNRYSLNAKVSGTIHG